MPFWILVLGTGDSVEIGSITFNFVDCILGFPSNLMDLVLLNLCVPFEFNIIIPHHNELL